MLKTLPAATKLRQQSLLRLKIDTGISACNVFLDAINDLRSARAELLANPAMEQAPSTRDSATSDLRLSWRIVCASGFALADVARDLASRIADSSSLRRVLEDFLRGRSHNEDLVVGAVVNARDAISRARDGKAELVNQKPPPTFAHDPIGDLGGWTGARIRELVKVDRKTLARYARLAAVPRPQRGWRHYRYPLADVRLIMQAIIANACESDLIEQARICIQAIREIETEPRGITKPSPKAELKRN